MINVAKLQEKIFTFLKEKKSITVDELQDEFSGLLSSQEDWAGFASAMANLEKEGKISVDSQSSNIVLNEGVSAVKDQVLKFISHSDSGVTMNAISGQFPDESDDTLAAAVSSLEEEGKVSTQKKEGWIISESLNEGKITANISYYNNSKEAQTFEVDSDLNGEDSLPLVIKRAIEVAYNIQELEADSLTLIKNAVSANQKEVLIPNGEEQIVVWLNDIEGKGKEVGFGKTTDGKISGTNQADNVWLNIVVNEENVSDTVEYWAGRFDNGNNYIIESKNEGKLSFKKINEAKNLLRQAKLSSKEYQDAKKLKNFKKEDYSWDSKEGLYTKKKKKISEDFISGGAYKTKQGGSVIEEEELLATAEISDDADTFIKNLEKKTSLAISDKVDLKQYFADAKLAVTSESKIKIFEAKKLNKITIIDLNESKDEKAKVAVWTNDEGINNWTNFAIEFDASNVSTAQAADLSKAISDATDAENDDFQVVGSKVVDGNLVVVEKFKPNGTFYISIVGKNVKPSDNSVDKTALEKIVEKAGFSKYLEEK